LPIKEDEIGNYQRDDDGHEFDEPDGAAGVDDADVDEHVRQVDDDDGAQEPQADPSAVVVDWQYISSREGRV